MSDEYNLLHIVVTKVEIVFQYMLSMLWMRIAYVMILDVIIHSMSVIWYSLYIVVINVAL